MKSNVLIQRDSNMELFRIVAMLLVMITHSAFLALGVPSQEDAVQHSASTMMRFFQQSISTVCVDSFVLLSGWYGIKLRWNRQIGFVFQVFFFSILIFIIMSIYNPIQYLNVRSLGTMFLLNESDYWFAKAYFGLMLIAPALNLLVENTTKGQLKKLLIVWFTFQTIYGWLSINGANWIGGGYSAASFAGLYLLARYVRLYPLKCWKWDWKIDISLFLIFVLIIAVVAFIVTYMGYPISGRLFTYTNPVVIGESLFLLLAFSKMSFKSRAINWIASSCFAVYLLHANELFLRAHYGRIIREWFRNESAFIFLCYTVCFIAFLFFLAILIDKIRKFLWDRISKRLAH